MSPESLPLNADGEAASEHPGTTEEASGPARVPGFHVALEQFEGPFDLLLTLIARRRLDVTELTLAEIGRAHV